MKVTRLGGYETPCAAKSGRKRASACSPYSRNRSPTLFCVADRETAARANATSTTSEVASRSPSFQSLYFSVRNILRSVRSCERRLFTHQFMNLAQTFEQWLE